MKREGVLRPFGTPLYWRCVTAGQHWIFDSEWGQFHLRLRNNGWYLSAPDSEDVRAGSTLTEAAQAVYPGIIAARRRS